MTMAEDRMIADAIWLMVSNFKGKKIEVILRKNRVGLVVKSSIGILVDITFARIEKSIPISTGTIRQSPQDAPYMIELSP
jgi:hypothetical protein